MEPRPFRPISSSSSPGMSDKTTAAFFAHSSAPRVATDVLIAKTLHKQYPNLKLTITPAGNCNLLAFAAAGHATCTPVDESSDSIPSSLTWKAYVSPARRMDGQLGGLAYVPKFGKYLYSWKGHEFIVYFVDGRDGTQSFPALDNYYILSADEVVAEQLLLSAGRWASELHSEIWVFEGGYWDKNAELFESAMKASWDAVIMDQSMKDTLIEDHLSFFRSRSTYENLKVPWKRGIIYYGPPGNGKTISIKATMNMLYNMDPPIPTLYVRSLTSFFGPEESIKAVFSKAREFAPCYLVFEDLDTIISDDVRSYFLNEMDGLKNNDGIFVIGSTNHLDRLDPGIAKRPSRFDRKYLFPDPNLTQREAYCHFWQGKLADNKAIGFPDKLCTAIAEITDGFSFAYMQEAFVAALLVIARAEDAEPPPGSSGKGEEQEDHKISTEDLVGDDDWVEIRDGMANEDEPELDELALWIEIQKQIALLREGMEQERD